MWIFTRDGFFSAVEHESDRDMLLIRARVKDDLEALADRLGDRRRDLGAEVERFEIEHTPTGDYHWRMPMWRYDWCAYIAEQARQIDYTTNVKGTLDKGEPDRHDFLFDVWDAGHRFQSRRNGTPVGGLDWDWTMDCDVCHGAGCSECDYKGSISAVNP